MGETVGSRKILLGTFLVAVGVMLDILTKSGLSPNMLDLLKWVGTGFFIGNVGEHFANALKANMSSDDSSDTAEAPIAETDTPSVDTSQIVSQINQIQQQNAVIQQAVGTTQQTLSFIITKLKIDQMP